MISVVFLCSYFFENSKLRHVEEEEVLPGDQQHGRSLQTSLFNHKGQSQGRRFNFSGSGKPWQDANRVATRQNRVAQVIPALALSASSKYANDEIHILGSSDG